MSSSAAGTKPVPTKTEMAIAREWVATRFTQAKSGQALPFSFTYDGKPSADMLPNWKRTVSRSRTTDGRTRRDISYMDSKTGLEVVCELTWFRDYPAVEWVLRLANHGTADTPILENILPLDAEITVGEGCSPALHYSKGSVAGPDDYIPYEKKLGKSDVVRFPEGKVYSQEFMPYFNLELSGTGIIGAIGWTGQWVLDVSRDAQKVRVRSGQQLTHLRLHPGERIRTPRILLVAWQGPDRIRGHNLLRRLLLAHYVPRIDGHPITPLMVGGNMDGNLNVVDEKMALGCIDSLAGSGVEVYERDAGWYLGRWPSSGSWTPDKELYPNGLKPLSDATHRNGMLFHLWFEPERASNGSIVSKEHPEWLLKRREGGWGVYSDQDLFNIEWPDQDVFNLGIPEARAWMTDLMSKWISDCDIDIYRQDRNLHPQRFWRDGDAKDRMGITEIRFVEGHYAFWNELLRRHPRLRIDNANWRCTGPDLEMVMRSMGSCSRNEWSECGMDPISNQVGTVGASLYVPVHANGIYTVKPYELRSVCVGGGGAGAASGAMKDVVAGWSVPDGPKAVAEVKLLRRLYQGDLYPLTPLDVNPESWCAWQIDRPELGEGAVIVVRRPKTPGTSLPLKLHALKSKAQYDVDFRETFDIRETKRMTGEELSRIKATIQSQPTALLIHYKRVDETH